jgi:glutathione S-transferase
MSDAYELYYWPTIQGRGEFVRLALEQGDAEYVDVARTRDGMRAMMRLLRDDDRGGWTTPFAPPFLKKGGRLIAQTANILAYLGPRLGLVPKAEMAQSDALSIQLTIADLVSEVHDTHHPIATSRYYEDQRPAAKARAASFTAERIPKFLGWIERRLARSGGEHLIGRRTSYVDLSAFQVVRGLSYAFPVAMGRLARSIPRLTALEERVAALPRIAAYLASDRRLAFNEDGIFRHYPELDERRDVEGKSPRVARSAIVTPQRKPNAPPTGAQKPRRRKS